MTPSDVKATLSFSDNSPSVEMPIYKGTLGPDVIDIRKLYGQTGKFTYDPGFMSTAACNSAITYIDGDKGELLYRGYPIEELAVKADFMETCYALLHGDLPTVEQKAEFVETVTKHTTHAGGDGVQVHDWPAVRLSAQQPLVQRELHAHDVLEPVRRVQGQRRARARAGPDPDPACGP